MIARVGKKDKGRGGGSSGFKYKKRTADQVKKRADQTGGNFDSPVLRGFDMWRPKAGENTIRILPPTWDDFEHYGYDVFMHRFIGSDSSNYLCLNKMKGKRCAACDEAKAFKDEGEDDEAKKMAFQKRCWVWIVDRDDKTLTPQVWDMSWSQDRDIAAMSNFKSGKVLLIDHPDDGYDVIIKKTGTGKNNTRYTITVDRDSSPISDDDDKQEEILNFISENPIPTTFNFFSNEHIAKKLEGTTEEKDKELDDDDTPRSKKAGKRDRDEDDDEDEKPSKKRRRDADDDDDEDERPKKKKRPADDDDDDEDERPKKKKKPADDDDDEDDTPRRRRKSDDDDDEDEKPKKKRRSDDDDDEDERPKKKKKPAEDDEDDEDERPKKKKKPADDDDDEDERPKKKKRSDDDDEDDRPAKKKKRKVEDEDDDD